ncbi:MAG: efflux RND transporter periplasmic adaptor subunit [Gammaproteobacteria bacterium]|nr:efflux RND transporter periplasmic adaptor subunit [Gammaproteobacteria bacterium]
MPIHVVPDLMPVPPSCARLHGRIGVPASVALAVVVAIGLLVGVFWPRGDSGEIYRTAIVDRGDVVRAVSAIGALSALVTVEVGSQVSGQVADLFADFNSEVSRGGLIARIDDTAFRARIEQAQAEVAVARANAQSAQAGLREAEAGFSDAQRTLARLTRLAEQNLVSSSEVDAAATLVEQLDARRAVARAQIETAQATIRLREAGLSAAQTDYEHTYIRSPVDGTVIERSVNIGQTVAASLQAPILFSIAQDLRQMQIEASIDEADIGSIEADQQVRFTVDAYPGRQFEGHVSQVRKLASTQQNVVTYTVVILVDNADLSLLPGMTANVDIETIRLEDVLRVPNAALRYRHTDDAAPTPSARPAAGARPRATGNAAAARSADVWRLESNASPVAVSITIGPSDGRYTAVLDGELSVGQALVTARLPAALAR